jgi:peptide/nickel transport system substrate-binding protein
MSMGRGLAIEQAMLLRQQWQEGTVKWIQSSWIVIYPQFTNPANPVVLNLPFRQALVYGTDRQALVDAMVGGLSSVANLWIAPSEPEFRDVEDAALRYTYEPRRAQQLIEDLGYSKGSDGIYQNSAGERLAVHVRSNGEPITQAAVVPLANMWTNLGVATEPEVLASQRLTDREYLATFPTFRMMRQFTYATSLANVHSTNIPLPENRFVGSNYARYSNPELRRNRLDHPQP